LRLYSKLKSGIVIISLLFIPYILHAGDYGASFLNIGVGPRGIAMANAFCSITDDAYSFFWNPAGYAMMNNRQISGMYGPQFGTISNPLANFNTVSIALPLKNKATIAFNWVRLAIDDIPVYGTLSGNSYYERLHDLSLRPTGEQEGAISDQEDALILSFAKLNSLKFNIGWLYNKFVVDVPFGVNFKWVHQSLGMHSASGFSMDAGFQVKINIAENFDTPALGMFSFGMFFRNVSGLTISWDTNHRDVVGASLVWGISQSLPVFSDKNILRISYDNDNQWGAEKSVGIEFSRKNVFALRAGFNKNGFTTGTGFSLWELTFDYAFISHQLNNLHRVGCKLNF